MNKIDYNDYYLAISYLVAQRSIDPSTKCGSVLVSADNRILSTGYNGPIRGVHDSRIPLERPAKYAHFIHAEENCILSYNGSLQDLEFAVMYVTGRPCHKCLRMIIQKGIHKIVYCDANRTVMQADEVEESHYRLMLDYAPHVEVLVLNNLPTICNILEETKMYIARKNPDIVLTKPKDCP